MAKFVVTRCKLREGRLFPVKGTGRQTLNWDELCNLLVPSGSFAGKATLRKGAQAQSYVLLLRQPNGVITNALVRNPDLSGDIRPLMARDPALESRLVDAYRFDSVYWDASVKEFASPPARTA